MSDEQQAFRSAGAAEVVTERVLSSGLSKIHSNGARRRSMTYMTRKLLQTGLSAAVSGTIVSLTTTVVLMLLAKMEGKAPLQPVNSTSHWLHGERAGSIRQADMAHTVLGYGTHHASAIFWAFLFEAWLSMRPPRSTLGLVRGAAATAAVAATVDYGVVPRRLSPGWEAVLSKRSIAAAFGTMTAGLVLGAIASRKLRRTHSGRE